MNKYFKNKHYKTHSIRISDATLKGLKSMRGGLSWNKFFLGMIREKEGKKCYFCGSTYDLEEHHIIARKDGGNNRKSNIMLLCVSCHKKIHGKR